MVCVVLVCMVLMLVCMELILVYMVLVLVLVLVVICTPPRKVVRQQRALQDR